MLGDSVPDWTIIDTVVAFNFDFEKSLDFLLRQQQGDASDDIDDAFSESATSPTSGGAVAMHIDAPAPRLFPSSALVLLSIYKSYWT